MITPELSNITIYPVKSMAGINLSSAFVTAAGIAFDRRFMLSTPDGELLSARQVPQMLQFSALLREEGIEFVAPDGERLTLRYPELFQYYRQVRVWGTEINAQHCGEIFDQWLSDKLGVACQLLYFGEQSERFTSRRPQQPVGFADGYPLLLISEASLADLNRRTATPQTMTQFRTNLVVSNTDPYAEDSWKRVRIGEVEFEVVKPCSRCIMTTYDPQTGQPSNLGEPLKTLANYRQGEDHEVYFGQNLIPLNEGQIRQGDTVTVLEYQTPEQYPDHSPVRPPAETVQSQQDWQPTQTVALTCCNRIQETPDVVTFRLQLPQSLTATYKAGQFITLHIPVAGEIISRCYTLSSSPSRCSDLAITVKRKEGGIVSNWLYEHLQIGDQINATGPQGAFNSDLATDQPLLLLSAGSGITPMLSMARLFCDQNSAREIIFYHQARTRADLICVDELAWLARQNPNLQLHFVLTQPDQNWQGENGRLNETQLQRLVPELDRYRIFCCGPEGFMSSARSLCQRLDHDPQHWFEESFDLGNTTDQQADYQELSLTLNGTVIKGDNQRPILEQAEQQGIRLNSGCRAGICGACKVQLHKGEVNRVSEAPLSAEEKASGIILACSCYPATDVEIIFPA